MLGLIEGELDWADILFLIAVILFGVAAFIRLAVRALDAALVALGAMSLAVAFLVL